MKRKILQISHDSTILKDGKIVCTATNIAIFADKITCIHRENARINVAYLEGLAYMDYASEEKAKCEYESMLNFLQSE